MTLTITRLTHTYNFSRYLSISLSFQHSKLHTEHICILIKIETKPNHVANHFINSNISLPSGIFLILSQVCIPYRIISVRNKTKNIETKIILVENVYESTISESFKRKTETFSKDITLQQFKR